MSLNLAALLELGELDRQLIRTRRRLSEASRLASPQQSRVDEAKRELERIKTATKLGAREVTRLEGEAKALKEEVEKTRRGLNDAKSNDVYQATLRAIERVQGQLGEVETRILEEYEAQDKRVGEEKRYQERLRQQEIELKAALGRVSQEEGKIKEELQALETKRAAAAAQVGPDHLELYQRILEKQGDSAVAEVVDEMCQGCFMRIRPEQISKVRGRSEIVICFTCGRILHGRF